jgi:hypothetical protein
MVSGTRGSEAAIKPQPETDLKRAALRLRTEREEEIDGADQVRLLLQQVAALAHRLTHQADLTMFQVAQTTMNEASGTAGGTGGKVMLLQQQRGSAGAGALARDRNPIDAAADNGNVEALSVQRFALLRPEVHVGLDAP